MTTASTEGADPPAAHDDLDDLQLLDSVLDEFEPAAAKPNPQQPATELLEKQQQQNNDDAFLADLTRGMEDMLATLTSAAAEGQTGSDNPASVTGQSEMGQEAIKDLLNAFTVPVTAADGTTASMTAADERAADVLTARMEQLFTASMSNDDTASNTTTTTSTTSAANPVDAAMNRLKQSSAKVSDDLHAMHTQPPVDAAEAEMMAAMLKSLGMDGMGGGGDGNGAAMDENAMAGMLESLMGQLVTRDVLYEPLSELVGKYEPWLAENKRQLAPEEYANYVRQHSLCRQIILEFDGGNDSAKIGDLLQQMQECGAPPAALLQLLAPGMAVGADGLPEMASAEAVLAAAMQSTGQDAAGKVEDPCKVQ